MLILIAIMNFFWHLHRLQEECFYHSRLFHLCTVDMYSPNGCWYLFKLWNVAHGRFNMNWGEYQQTHMLKLVNPSWLYLEQLERSLQLKCNGRV